MGLVLRFVGSLLIGFGVLVALFPFISTARVSSVILSELPDTVSGSSADDEDQYGSAIFDEDFVLATRTYETATTEEVEQALVAAGYQRVGSGDDVVWSKDCCGEWDAARVTVTENNGGRTVATMSVYDTDIQISWPFISAVGLIPGFAGLILVARNPRRSGSRPVDPSVLVD